MQSLYVFGCPTVCYAYSATWNSLRVKESKASGFCGGKFWLKFFFAKKNFFQILIAICLSFIGNLDQLISYMSFALWSQRTCTQAGFIYFKLRGTLKSKNSFEVPIFVPIVFFIICIALLVIPITQVWSANVPNTTNYKISELPRGNLRVEYDCRRSPNLYNFHLPESSPGGFIQNQQLYCKICTNYI